MSEENNKIDESLLAPNVNLCALAEQFEDKAYRSLQKDGKSQLAISLFSKMQKVFLDDFRKALNATAQPLKTHLLDYKEWTLAGDSFMINETKIYTIALAERASKKLSDDGISDFMIDEPDKLKNVAVEIISGKSIAEDKKPDALSSLISHANKSGFSFKKRDTLYLTIEGEIEKIENESFKKSITEAFKESEKYFIDKRKLNSMSMK